MEIRLGHLKDLTSLSKRVNYYWTAKKIIIKNMCCLVFSCTNLDGRNSFICCHHCYSLCRSILFIGKTVYIYIEVWDIYDAIYLFGGYLSWKALSSEQIKFQSKKKNVIIKYERSLITLVLMSLSFIITLVILSLL